MVDFSGVHAKLDRAESVIEELNEAIVGYLAEGGCELVDEFDRESSEYVIRGKVARAVPPHFGVLVGDVCHNLRSSLDHVVWQLALLTTDAPRRATQFPISQCEDEFASKRGQNMISDLSPDNRALIKALQPHNGTHPSAPYGVPALAELRVLSNTDKHRLINTTLPRKIRDAEVEYTLAIVRDIDSYSIISEFTRGPIDGAEIVRLAIVGAGADPKVEMKGQMPVTVCFDDPALSVQDAAVISVLRPVLRGIREIVAVDWDLEVRKGMSAPHDPPPCA